MVFPPYTLMCYMISCWRWFMDSVFITFFIIQVKTKGFAIPSSFSSDISSTFLQQRQYISLASFLQYQHLRLPTFPIVISDKSAAEAWLCLSLSHGFYYFFPFQAQTEMVKGKLSEGLHCHLHFTQNSHLLS